ncbi:hypothetical protein BDW_13620 [Bdellovibrio bacteriovorus W]|nr:hypothetical protein BDW_13620 [Bdellovibrio bacteriovorus W]
MKKYISAFALFAVTFSIGFSLYNSEESEYQSLRNPAAVQSSYDFSHLSGAKLENALKDRILAGLHFEKRPENTKIQLGHFVFVNDQGQRVFGCEQFQEVTLTFEAEGASVAGAKPRMEVKGLCQQSNDMTKISSLFIPVNQILNETPTDSEFSYNGESEVSIRFVNLADEWPRLWLLKQVSFNGAKQSKLVIESDEVAQVLGHPVVLKF